MKRLFVVALISLAFTGAAYAQPRAQCIVATTGGPGILRLINTCGVCQVAMVNYVPGSVAQYKVQGHGWLDVHQPAGSATLVGDFPCAG